MRLIAASKLTVVPSKTRNKKKPVTSRLVRASQQTDTSTAVRFWIRNKKQPVRSRGWWCLRIGSHGIQRDVEPISYISCFDQSMPLLHCDPHKKSTIIKLISLSCIKGNNSRCRVGASARKTWTAQPTDRPTDCCCVDGGRRHIRNAVENDIIHNNTNATSGSTKRQ